MVEYNVSQFPPKVDQKNVATAVIAQNMRFPKIALGTSHSIFVLLFVRKFVVQTLQKIAQSGRTEII